MWVPLHFHGAVGIPGRRTKKNKGEPNASSQSSSQGLWSFWTKEAGGRQREFWRWSAGIGWTLDFLLLAWALFLRSAASTPAGGAAAEAEEAQRNLEAQRYDELLRRNLQEEEKIAKSDSQLKGLLLDSKSTLLQLRARVEALLRPEVEEAPRYEDAVLSGMVDDLQDRLETDRSLLLGRDDKLLGELQGKTTLLRELSVRLGKQKQVEQDGSRARPSTMFVAVKEAPPAPNINGDEVVLFLEGSVFPVGTFLTATLFVTILSQQFVRVATDWRRKQWAKAEKARKIQVRRFQTFQRSASEVLLNAAQGRLDKAQKGLGDLADFVGRWSSEPTWEELFRAEGAAFWERWGPDAFRLEAKIPGLQSAPRDDDAEMTKWVASKWFSSAQEVVKGYVLGALTAWAKAPDAQPPSSPGPTPTCLVIRIFGRWPTEDWVNIANLPLAGDWREKALRLLLPAEKDLQDFPFIGTLCETALTAVVSSQVSRVVSTSVWGSLTTDLWRSENRQSAPQSRRPSREIFEIGYEVVEVPSQTPDEMVELARGMSASGTPGGVVRVRPEIESTLGNLGSS
mmetsp:Transcript_124264/g.397511  ORF Transcript_124264/g.397511 Transcript_124264/m.397511 type:complete len:568 (-) Transcript_124264:60-1763(-)